MTVRDCRPPGGRRPQRVLAATYPKEKTAGVRRGWLLKLAISAFVAAGTGYAATELTTKNPPASPRWTVTSVAVPNEFNQLLAEGSSLFLKGFSNSCQSTTVDPQSLTLEASPAACDEVPPGEKFAVQYGRFGPLQNFWNCKPESAAVRLVSVDPATHKDVVGRVIMRVSGTCSHDYPLTVYANGAMWVYDSSAGPTGSTGAIAELSATTGALETFATVPGMPAAVLAADDDGFYIGPGEFYQSGEGIYHVDPRSSRAQLVRSVPGPMAWMFGIGHSMYAALQHGYADPCVGHDCQLWRFEGPRATPTLISRSLMPGDELPENGPVGNTTVGILVTRPQQQNYASTFDVVLIDPSTGTTQVGARFPVSRLQFAESSAYVSGALYV
jgi:hypothetical protein